MSGSDALSRALVGGRNERLLVRLVRGRLGRDPLRSDTQNASLGRICNPGRI